MTDEQPPPSIDDMKAAIKANHERLVVELAKARERRDSANAQIRSLVAQVKEAERLVKALEPRRRST